jgi:hypothetical protein
MKAQVFGVAKCAKELPTNAWRDDTSSSGGGFFGKLFS